MRCAVRSATSVSGRGLGPLDRVGSAAFFRSALSVSSETRPRSIFSSPSWSRLTRAPARLGELPAKAGAILEAILSRGELPRGDVGYLAGTTDRHGRRVIAPLVDRGVLVSNGPREPLRLAFPAALASRWMPRLFPDQVGAG